MTLLRAAAVPLLSVALAILVGGIIIELSGENAIEAYRALYDGALANRKVFGRTLEKATPLVMGGLAVAFAFKAGLFNIGGQGQLVIGALFAAAVGYGVTGLPWIIHLPMALLVGGIAGAAWGMIPGLLKATRGAHEVITTIMLNFVAINLTDWLTAHPWRQPGPITQTPHIEASAEIPRWGELPLGFGIAVAAAVGCWYLLQRTTMGFEIRSVGLNPEAARYAGISVPKIVVLTMTISGFLAALGGAIETQGVVGRYEPGFNAGLGFNGITIALLARTHPIGVIPAALLVGAMEAGGSMMQFKADVQPEITEIIEALMLLFVATPIVVRWVLRRRETSDISVGAHWGDA
jgi:simple sugar transport system permease protein